MIIQAKVIPKSSQNLILQEDEIFKIKINTAPKKGKANNKVIELLSQHFKVPKSKIEIIKGLTSRSKIVRINIDK